MRLVSRELSDVQKRELAAFVTDLFARSGLPTRAEFARRAGYPATNLSDVMNGKQGIDGYNLMQLIRASGVSLADAAGLVMATDEELLREVRQAVAANSERLDRIAELLEVVVPSWVCGGLPARVAANYDLVRLESTPVRVSGNRSDQ